MKRYGTLLLGLLTIAGLAVSLVMSSGSASAATTTVPVGDIYFCNESFQDGVCTTTITAGDTVVWDFSDAQIAHTVTECGASCSSPTSSPVFESGVVQGGGDSFQFTFTTSGTYNYYCQIHSLTQQGKIVVQQASAATPSAGTATPRFVAPPVDYGDSRSKLPTTGFGPQSHSSSLWWAFGALAVIGATLVSFSAMAFARTRKP